jgi:hypothetical protein
MVFIYKSAFAFADLGNGFKAIDFNNVRNQIFVDERFGYVDVAFNLHAKDKESKVLTSFNCSFIFSIILWFLELAHWDLTWFVKY